MKARFYVGTVFGLSQEKVLTEHDNIKYLALGKDEICETTGRLHFHFYIELRRPQRIKYVQNMLGIGNAHLEVREGTRQQAKDYMLKAGIAREVNGTNGTVVSDLVRYVKEGKTNKELLEMDHTYIYKYSRFIKDVRKIYYREQQVKEAKDRLLLDHKFVELNEFQKRMMKAIENMTIRQVLWAWDRPGKIGKSVLADYLLVYHKAIVFPNAKTADIAFAYDGEPLIIFDFPRTIEGHVNYFAIEQLLNGRIFSSKYESTTKQIRIPKVVVLANFPPTYKALSRDRWIEYCDGEPATILSEIFQGLD